MTMVRDAKKPCPDEGLDHAPEQNVGSPISEEPGGHGGRTVSRHRSTAVALETASSLSPGVRLSPFQQRGLTRPTMKGIVPLASSP